MSEQYTPTEARVCIDFCNAAIQRRQPDGSFISMEEADAAFSRWLAEHDRQVAERAFDAGFEKATGLTSEDFWSDAWSDDHSPYRKEQSSE